MGEPHSYRFNTFDDNGGGNDVTNQLDYRGWIGDNGGGHRHSAQQNVNNSVGPDTFAASSDFNLASGAAGDDIGITAGVGGDAPNATLFVDNIEFRGIVAASGGATFVESLPTPTASGVITGVTLNGTGLAPEGASVETGLFGEDALMFTDRTHEWNSAAGEPTIAELGLVGLDYIQFANDDKSVSDFEAEVSLADGEKNLYLLLDNRLSDNQILDVLNGNSFVDTGVDIGADENGDVSINNISSLFVLPNFSGDSITLGPQPVGSSNF